MNLPLTPEGVEELLDALEATRPAWDYTYDSADGGEEQDLSFCPYFTNSGTCAFGCYDEPRCHTCHPREGWPSERLVDVIGPILAERRAKTADR